MPNIEKLKQALTEYTGDIDSLNHFTETATAELGSDWAQHIYETLDGLSADDKNKLDHAFQYYAALTAWEELQSYLTQTTPLNPELIQERIPVLSHWLAFFGDPGEDAVNQLREKIHTQSNESTPQLMMKETDEAISDSESQLSQETSSESDRIEIKEEFLQQSDEIPITEVVQSTDLSSFNEPQQLDNHPIVEQQKAEPIWAVEKVFKQIAMTQSVQAWIAARCIDLGNIEVFAYPHYGFLVDLMQQTLKEIKELLASQELLASIDEAYSNGIRQLQNMQLSLEKDLQIAYQNTNSEETPLTKESLSGADVKRLLGRLDTSNQAEYLGPAPDGFETIIDPYEDLNENSIKEEYRQIENVVLLADGKSQMTNIVKNNTEKEKSSSQTLQNGVKGKLSFSLGNKPHRPSEN